MTDSSSTLGRLLGRPGPIPPYQYQDGLGTVLAQGRNAVVSAPTGAGKTWAALLPYLMARQLGDPTWDRVLYALPLRSLATSLWRSTRAGCEKLPGEKVVTHERRWGAAEPNELAVTIQTGEQRLDPFLTGDIIFLTIDQLLGTYLNTPLSLPQKVSNINPGALLGSLVVLDEVHLLDPARSLGTSIDLAERLRGHAQVVVMTATLSTPGLDRLASLLDAVVVRPSNEELATMPAQRDKQRTWRWSPVPLTAEAVLERHRQGRSLVLCNSVTRAQDLYEALDNALNGWPGVLPRLQLLHSRFLRQDRSRVEDTLDDAFGPGDTNADEILVATQVVEAGLDISADELHTEVCPANSLIQRAGRCARYPAPRNVGTVTVYELERDEQGRRKLGPYRDRDAAPLVDLAAAAVQQRHERTLGFADEQTFLDETLADSERRLFDAVEAAAIDRRKQVSWAIDTGDRSLIPKLVREVDSVGLLVHGAPEHIRLEDGPELLAVPRTALWNLIDAFASRDAAGEWSAKVPREPGEQDEAVIAGWAQVTFNEARSAPWLLALHPALAQYDQTRGLRLGRPGHSVDPPLHDPVPFLRPCYRCETFREHAERTRAACVLQGGRSSRATEQIERRLALPPGSAERLAEIACALHDTGKLTDEWQKAIVSWQRHKQPGFVSTEPLAHSDYDVADWRDQRAPEFRRRPHALEGAYAVTAPLATGLVNLLGAEHAVPGLRSVITAIGRHHAGHARSLNPFTLSTSADEEVRRVCNTVGLRNTDPLLSAPSSLSCKDFASYFIRADDPVSARWLPMYWFIARRLRLADQAATAQHASAQ